MKTVLLAGILIMNTFANAGFAAPPAPAEPATLKVDGSRAQVIAAAVPAFTEQAPGSQLENYLVHVQAPQDGLVHVVFQPKLPEGQPPSFGGWPSGSFGWNTTCTRPSCGAWTWTM